MCLDLIGAHRGDAIGYEIEGRGVVWSALSNTDQALEVLSTHVDVMIDPEADLSELASELVDAFIANARDEADGFVLSEFLRSFEQEIKKLLAEKDVLPALHGMRQHLLQRLDQ